ncbi:MAG: M20/M25/M40 family metallo-hydrolase [Tannerella sp.]|nr:M20/M25/M40 family metallo-hydrolase [Tannerella sp.]
MSKLYLLMLVGLCAVSSAVYAQGGKNAQADKNAQVGKNKGLESITKQGVEARLSFLASDALEGREAGKLGGLVASEYIQSELKGLGVKPFYRTYFQDFEAISPVREKAVDFQVNSDSISKYKAEKSYRRLALRNVIGYIEGQKKDEYIVIGAHFDHVGVDELLVGDQIYNGADDNASSVAAVLQVAEAFASSADKPLYSIIFAFWDGEEVNYLGSDYFVANFASLSNIKTYINLDMIGREGFVPTIYPDFALPETIDAENNALGKEFHFLSSNELTKYNELLSKEIEKNKLNIRPKFTLFQHKSTGSDYLHFSLHNIPVIWFFTGLHPDYHTPIDEVERIDLDKVTDITRATYLILWSLANDK